MRKLRKKEQEQSEAQGSVADNPEGSHPSDQEADLQGIDQNMAPDKTPETPEVLDGPAVETLETLEVLDGPDVETPETPEVSGDPAVAEEAPETPAE